MAYQNSKQNKPVQIAAKGNAPHEAPGPTPAPTRTYKNPVLVERDETVGYAQAKNLGPSSIAPGIGGGDSVSALGQELKRVGALSDAGDHLQDVINRGTARDSTVDLDASAPQTRAVSSEPDCGPAHGATSQQEADPAKWGTIPKTLGASAADDSAARRAERD
jgi:hypothetical protein